MRRRILIAIVLALSTIPLPPLARAGDAACGLSGAPTATVYLPNITKTLGGPAGWVTPFIVQNVGTVPTTLEVSFYDFATGALVTCLTAPGLAPQTSFSHIPNLNAGLQHGSAFSVVVRSFGSDVVAVVNQHQGEGVRQQALSYVGLSSGATTVGLPWVARQDGGWLTTFIVQNLGTAPATAKAAFANQDGTRTATLSRTIQPGRSWAVNPANEPKLLDGTSYAVVLTSDQPVGVVANAHNDAPGTPQPMAFSYNGAPLLAGDTYVPWVARNAEGGRTTTVVVQNLGTFEASPQLTLRRIGTAAQLTIPLAPIPPGRSLRYPLPTTASCPAAGSGVCPAEGEHALTVSGGSFAVLSYALGGGSAMGGTGTTAASGRVYLPNITRTLGGAAGWTTPIVIQSAGATTAMLRWYRFADGKLAITQYVGGLLPGASVKVDPRSVAELSESTQYGVVVDGNGPLRASVLALSLSGGDGAMSYEGFAATGTTGIPTVTSIAVTPATSNVTFGATVQLVATVRDQSSNTVVGVPLAWTVEPASLGTITNTGAFTAGTTAGTGTVRVTGLGLTATTALSVVAQTQTIGSQTFRIVRTASTDVYVEQTITAADAQSIVTVVDPSVKYIETSFGRTFEQRPQIYVFPDHASYTLGYGPVLGATGIPEEVNGVFVGLTTRIGLNWGNVKTSVPYGTVRHELVHQMDRQITKRVEGQVPLWFIEGLAAMHDLTEPGSGWDAMKTRYWTASNANAGRLFATTLTSEQFRALGLLDANVAYAESAETLRLMYQDLGTAGVLSMLELVGTGMTLTSAYEARAGRPLKAFLAQKDARLRALAPSYPGIVTAADTPDGPGLTYMGYGLPVNTAVTVTITGAGYVPTVVTGTTDAYGLVWSYLDKRWRVGTYTFTITAGAVTVTTSAVKASGVSGLSVSPVADGDVAPPQPQLPEWRPR